MQADQGVLSLQKDPKKQDRVHQQHHDAEEHLPYGGPTHGFLAENDGHGTLHAEAPSQPPHWESAYQPATRTNTTQLQVFKPQPSTVAHAMCDKSSEGGFGSNVYGPEIPWASEGVPEQTLPQAPLGCIAQPYYGGPLYRGDLSCSQQQDLNGPLPEEPAPYHPQWPQDWASLSVDNPFNPQQRPLGVYPYNGHQETQETPVSVQGPLCLPSTLPPYV